MEMNLLYNKFEWRIANKYHKLIMSTHRIKDKNKKENRVKQLQKEYKNELKIINGELDRYI